MTCQVGSMNSSLLGSLGLCLTPVGLRNKCPVPTRLARPSVVALWPAPVADVSSCGPTNYALNLQSRSSALVRNRWKACSRVARTPRHCPLASAATRCCPLCCSTVSNLFLKDTIPYAGILDCDHKQRVAIATRTGHVNLPFGQASVA